MSEANDTSDHDALAERYAAERAKRVRPEGAAQYIHGTGAFAHYLDDPNRTADAGRAPRTDELDVVIIGGGMSGLLAAVALREQGIDSFTIVESGADFGGVWYWNRYPGAACDVEAHVYMPLLEETGYIPSEKYARSPEIRQHLRRIGRHFGLYEHALFGTQATRIAWDEAIDRWTIATDRGDLIRARSVLLGSGTLNHPKLPGIPGIETFAGHAFHTSRWDYDYSGGRETGELDGLRGKRVAVIGTGSTGIQVAPEVAKWADKLLVVQRTPSIVARRDNSPTDPAWAETLTPGWQEARIEHFEKAVSGLAPNDVIGDAWPEIWGPPGTPPPGMDPREHALSVDFAKMEEMRVRVSSIVRDPATAEALKPYYYRFCKRPCFHDEYLQMFNQANVELVDTQGRGVERIEPRGIVVDGKLHEVDCIVFATGFDLEVGAFTHETRGFSLTGRGGVDIEDRWRNGYKSLHGITVAGFPNLFLVGAARHTANTFNYPFMVREHARHAAAVVAKILARGTAWEPSEAEEAEWARAIEEKSRFDTDYSRSCTPSYFNTKGDENGVGKVSYGGGIFDYRDRLADWRTRVFG